MTIIEILDEVPDPRRYNIRHELTDILFVALAAVLCGAVDCTGLAVFAETRLELLRQIVPLKNGAPSHNTFSAVFGMLDPDAFATAFGRFMAAFGAQARADTRGHLAVDGKSLRGAYDKGRAHMPPLMVTVFDCEAFMSLAPVLAAKGGEAQGAIEALNILCLKGRTVTADALHCHRRMTKALRGGGGHYVIAIKGNQSKLAAQAGAALDKAAARPRAPIFETETEAHGRHEVRRVIVTSFTQTPGPKALVGLVAVARVEVWRTCGETTKHEVRAYALSRRMAPAELLRTVQSHWEIENNPHWQLDVLMGEDQARTRKKNGPANLAALRRLALNVLRSDPRKITLSHKRLKAGWNPQELLNLMTHMR
ncbi:MAG: ISAs1 family transposase [Caulobacteraceae bacterium]|nr:ISAs1 family transposase [Caulobacteraceae bacterium]